MDFPLAPGWCIGSSVARGTVNTLLWRATAATAAVGTATAAATTATAATAAATAAVWRQKQQ